MDDSVAVFDLSPAEKLQLVEDLWDELSADPESVPVRDWHQKELVSRKKRLEQTPESTKLWDEVKTNVRNLG